MIKEILSRLRKVVKTESAVYRDTTTNPEGKRRREEYEHEQQDEAGDHFEELRRAAEIVNVDLERRNAPYRFFLHQEDDEVFINIVILGVDGNIKEIQECNITHQEFSTWINHIEKGEGFFIDNRG